MPKVKFDELLAAARLGRLPSDITIEVEGMGYIVPPHGEGLKWDNKALPQLDIVDVDFIVPLISQAISRPSDQVSGPTRSQVNDLSEKLDRLATAIESGLRSLLWAALLIGALILILRILG